jgi:signal transduction histidine kinase
VEEKVRLERKLSERERLAILGQMAAQVAHEVKNPLSAIKSIAQVMREEDALKNYEQDLSLIVSEIDRLNRTVSQLLAFSRPRRAEQRPVALADLINSTVTLASVEAAERGVLIKVDEIDDVTLTGAEAGALREALSNLVINAVQAIESGGEVCVGSSVEIYKPAINFKSAALKESHRSQPSSGASATAELVLTVTDTGVGIPAEAQQKVFEPFYSTKSRGTGLGLAIVQRRVVEIGGMVELISPVENNRGTRFRLRVPLAPSSTND